MQDRSKVIQHGSRGVGFGRQGHPPPGSRPGGERQPERPRSALLGPLAGHGESNRLKRCQLPRHYVVPEGHVFVMGDNREKSSDSRVWGPVALDDIKGKALFVWWAGKAPGAAWHWDRVGELVH